MTAWQRGGGPTRSAASFLVVSPYMMCSSAQLSRTRIPISPGSPTGNSAMLSGSNLGHSRRWGLSRRLSPVGWDDFDGFFRFFTTHHPQD